MGALIEALAQPLFIWLFSLATYGLYVVLWGAINLISNLVDLSMTSALQRVVPASENEEQVHGAVRFALLVTVLPATLIAAIATLNADLLATFVSAAPEDRANVPAAIRLFAWALPLWTFIEVATSAARARRAFGPEIRLRIFWEQIARIAFALVFFAVGFGTHGLFAAHLSSLLLTALLCVPLLARYYSPPLLFLHAKFGGAQARNLLVTGLALLPSTFSRRLLIDAPPVVLNFMLPGALGATAAGLFEVGRKISTMPYIVRQAFQYVLGPLFTAQAAAGREMLAPLYRFATRVSTALVLPLAAFLIFAAPDILSVYKAEAMAALPLLIILVGGRAIEALAGPATTLVEMTGHRGLPLLNSLIGTIVWALLAFLLVPRLGATGMAWAVAAATAAVVWAAAAELRIIHSISAVDFRVAGGIAVGLVGGGLMGIAAKVPQDTHRVVLLLALWAATSWCALRFGLGHEDREALGPVARRMRLVGDVEAD